MVARIAAHHPETGLAETPIEERLRQLEIHVQAAENLALASMKAVAYVTFGADGVDSFIETLETLMEEADY